MNEKTALILAACAGLAAVAAVFWQALRERQRKTALRRISRRLEEILDADSDENVMVFTDDKALAELAAQINRLLESRRNVRADYRRTEVASKKMLSNISHDIKTPMTVILGYLEILRLRDGNEMLEKVERKAKGVMELIDQFFSLAKLESGDTCLEMERMDLCEVCRESILDFYELLTEKEFQVEIGIPAEPVYVLGSREAVQRILYNLISNAVRYGSDGKYAGIFLKTDGQAAYVEVADRGKGISRAQAEAVFDRLFTGEDSRNREIQGNGLGLSIARGLARQMGGEITLDSEPHVRTVFTLRLKKTD